MRRPRRVQGLVNFIRLSGAERADAVRAMAELAKARRRLTRISAAQVAAMDDLATPAPSAAQTRTAERVRQAIARAARVVPWRSDCLVQALAARAWLEQLEVPTRLRLGARRGAAALRPDTHAWLLCGKLVVTGGSISGFQPFATVIHDRDVQADGAAPPRPDRRPDSLQAPSRPKRPV